MAWWNEEGVTEAPPLCVRKYEKADWDLIFEKALQEAEIVK